MKLTSLSGSRVLQILALGFFLVLILSLFVPASAFSQKKKYRTLLFPNGVSLKAEVADTPKARERGLMFRKKLSENEGMLFVFETPGRYRFWTKNCQIPLDILWLDQYGKVIDLVENAPPCTKEPCPLYGPDHLDSHYVVETAGGVANKNHLERGMLLRFS